MPRVPREQSSSGCYHVIIRGNNKQTLFPEPQDFEKFIELMISRLDSALIHLYHYCLMTNHVHLVMRCENKAHLARYMHSIQRSYHHHYRKTYTLFGHLTQGRYRSFPIEEDAYLLECGRYVERNPVRAGLVSNPEDWPYSSYGFYAFGRAVKGIESSVSYLGLASETSIRQEIYRERMMVTRPYEDLLFRRLQKM